VRVAAAELLTGDRLGLGALPVQDDRLRVVEAGQDVDPAACRTPARTGQRVAQDVSSDAERPSG
jgi:hypothetical protein